MHLDSLTLEEFIVATRAVKAYNDQQERRMHNELIMNTKKFNYGDVVINKRISGAGRMFGLGEDEIGVIVGHYDIDDFDGYERDMFRVYFNENNSYIGFDGDWLELYEGEIPERLHNVKWNKRHDLRVKVDDIE